MTHSTFQNKMMRFLYSTQLSYAAAQYKHHQHKQYPYHIYLYRSYPFDQCIDAFLKYRNFQHQKDLVIR